MARRTGRLTEAEAAAIAERIERDEIEFEFHPIADAPAPLRGRGRPSLTGAAQTSPRVSFRVTPAIRAQAAARAEREGKSVSGLARDALERYLAS